ncbi:adenosine 5'-monophosphoramidase HINT3-like [Daktulosphaira vitifoliae]|uniref:adenosine 5'-monophosphoramidase HINT3-like n=1 Tax=Daktulosphaira vitifoliae TaxID=58002 RepID=UPI0021AA8539|nr:adenosine 5'-monophosphoramidase HINT3-like [Daktulosphaira vitifoliae]
MSEKLTQTEQNDNNTCLDSEFDDKKCVFCEIIAKNDPTKILEPRGNKFVIVKDIHPVANHHFLVISREHIPTVKSLKPIPEHRELLNSMFTAAKQVLVNNGETSLSNSRFGFHWPPFYTVGHLHLHAISPVNSMAWYFRYIGFNPHCSLIFVDINYVRKRIGSIDEEIDKNSKYSKNNEI